MFNVTTDIQPLSYFKRHTPDVLKHLESTGRPMVLTIDGKAKMVVMDAQTYQQQLTWEKNEMEGFLTRSRQDFAEGKTVTAEELFSELRKTHGV